MSTKRKSNIETTVTMTPEDFDRLTSDSIMLTALIAAGVENWEGYKYAQAILNGGVENEAEK